MASRNGSCCSLEPPFKVDCRDLAVGKPWFSPAHHFNTSVPLLIFVVSTTLCHKVFSVSLLALCPPSLSSASFSPQTLHTTICPAPISVNNHIFSFQSLSPLLIDCNLTNRPFFGLSSLIISVASSSAPNSLAPSSARNRHCLGNSVIQPTTRSSASSLQ